MTQAPASDIRFNLQPAKFSAFMLMKEALLVALPMLESGNFIGGVRSRGFTEKHLSRVYHIDEVINMVRKAIISAIEEEVTESKQAIKVTTDGA